MLWNLGLTVDDIVVITADDEVVVYGCNIEAYSNDAFLAFPTDVLGKEYYTVSHHPTTRPCEFMIIGRSFYFILQFLWVWLSWAELR